MLRIVELKHAPVAQDLYCPVFICDACGEMITDGHWGLFAWVIDPATGAPVTGRVHTVHKRGCDEALEAEAVSAGYRWLTMELNLLPTQLAANLQKDGDAPRLADEWLTHRPLVRPPVIYATVED